MCISVKKHMYIRDFFSFNHSFQALAKQVFFEVPAFLKSFCLKQSNLVRKFAHFFIIIINIIIIITAFLPWLEDWNLYASSQSYIQFSGVFFKQKSTEQEILSMKKKILVTVSNLFYTYTDGM